MALRGKRVQWLAFGGMVMLLSLTLYDTFRRCPLPIYVRLVLISLAVAVLAIMLRDLLRKPTTGSLTRRAQRPPSSLIPPPEL